MRYLLLALLLSGCTTVVPVTAKFPAAPATAIEECPKLNAVQDDPKLSGLTQNVASNYTLYYECSVKVQTWNEWYQSQKKIFEQISK